MRNPTKDYNDPPYRRYATTLYPRQMMILMLLVENARKNGDVEVLALNKLVRGVRPKMMVVALDGYTVYTCDLCLVNVSVILLKKSKVLKILILKRDNAQIIRWQCTHIYLASGRLPHAPAILQPAQMTSSQLPSAGLRCLQLACKSGMRELLKILNFPCHPITRGGSLGTKMLQFISLLLVVNCGREPIVANHLTSLWLPSAH